MKKMAGFILVLVQIVSLSCFAQFIAGNHGEGVLLNEKIYLRDLYIRGQLDGVYFGTQVNPQILERMSGFDRLPLTPIQMDLLIQKLSDMESLSPCLGKIVSDAFYLYNWHWTPEQFRTPPDNEEVTHIPEEQRVVVAKRYRSDIFLQRQAWEKMPEPHQVALLIHEVIYSLVRPSHKPDVKGVAYQDVHVARALVSLFFSKPTVYSSSEFEVLARDLAIQTGVSCEQVSRYQVQALEGRIVASSSALRSEIALEDKLKDFCIQAFARSPDFTVAVSVQTSPYSLQELRYTAFDGQDVSAGTGRQTRIKVCSTAVELRQASIRFTSIEACTATLKRQIFDWGNPKDFKPSAKGCLGNP